MRLAGLMLAAAFMLGCTASSFSSPSQPAFRPLPPDVAGLPRPGEPSVVLQPRSQRGAVAPGAERRFDLGHCGLGSPIDFDGSLWNPIAGDEGAGGPLTEDHRSELINQTSGTLIMLTGDLARFVTPLGAVVTLARLPAGRPYYFCD